MVFICSKKLLESLIWQLSSNFGLLFVSSQNLPSPGKLLILVNCTPRRLVMVLPSWLARGLEAPALLFGILISNFCLWMMNLVLLGFERQVRYDWITFELYSILYLSGTNLIFQQKYIYKCFLSSPCLPHYPPFSPVMLFWTQTGIHTLLPLKRTQFCQMAVNWPISR